MLRDQVRTLLGERQKGFSLPQAFYVDEEIFKADIEAVFETDWLFACNVCEIKRPGDYLTTREIGSELGHDPCAIGTVKSARSTTPAAIAAPASASGEGPRPSAGLPLSPSGSTSSTAA